MELKTGDKCHYATIMVQTHGFMIRTNHEPRFARIVDVTEAYGVELLGTSGIATHNVSIKADELNKMVWDIRSKDGASFIMVYRHGLTQKQILDIIKPQIREHFFRLRKAYQTLVTNVEEMIEATTNDLPVDHICPPMKPLLG